MSLYFEGIMILLFERKRCNEWDKNVLVFNFILRRRPMKGVF